MMGGMETTTLALTEFLHARIADDLDTGEHVVAGLRELRHQPGSISFNGREVYDLRRVVREIEAKRRIVELHRPSTDHGAGYSPYCVGCWEEGGMDGAPLFPCRTIRILVDVYADHPDFHHEWLS